MTSSPSRGSRPTRLLVLAARSEWARFAQLLERDWRGIARDLDLKYLRAQLGVDLDLRQRDREPAHDFAGTNESTSATLARCEIEMLRGLDCVQRTPSRSQYSQNSPRMSADRFEKKYRG